MESKAKLFGHPLHQMLVVFPLGVLGIAVLFDIVGLIRGHGSWFDRSYWMIAAGVLTGVVAALPGLVDWLAIPANTRAKQVGLWHALGNVMVLICFGLSWWLRSSGPFAPGAVALGLSFIGFALSGVTAWLGGELVDRLGVGVDDGAHLDAPNSLSARSARSK